MAVYADTSFPKRVNTKFVVRNIAPGNKRIKIFLYPIDNGKVRDLLTIPYISEADIRHSLLKGQLLIKLLCKEIEIVESNIDLLQFDPEQRAFLYDAGVRTGLEVTGFVTTEQYERLIQTLRLSDGDGPVSGFPEAYRYTLPEGDPFPTTIIWYDNNTPAQKKITEKTLTYDDQKRIINNTQVSFAEDGITVVAQIVDDFTYNGPFEIIRHRIITEP